MLSHEFSFSLEETKITFAKALIHHMYQRLALCTGKLDLFISGHFSSPQFIFKIEGANFPRIQSDLTICILYLQPYKHVEICLNYFKTNMRNKF